MLTDEFIYTAWVGLIEVPISGRKGHKEARSMLDARKLVIINACCVGHSDAQLPGLLNPQLSCLSMTPLGSGVVFCISLLTQCTGLSPQGSVKPFWLTGIAVDSTTPYPQDFLLRTYLSGLAWRPSQKHIIYHLFPMYQKARR